MYLYIDMLCFICLVFYCVILLYNLLDLHIPVWCRPTLYHVEYIPVLWVSTDPVFLGAYRSLSSGCTDPCPLGAYRSLSSGCIQIPVLWVHTDELHPIYSLTVVPILAFHIHCFMYTLLFYWSTVINALF